MAEFIQQINDFQSYGTYNYKFDEVGNQILNPSSSVFQQNYISLPTTDYIYDESKIMSFYDVRFQEFQPAPKTGSSMNLPQEIIDQVNQLTQQNMVLQNQLDTMVADSEYVSTSADKQVIKDIIISLRIQLGQGTTTSDFYTDFPYLPIPLEQRDL
jgi:hypothetical protein